MPGKFKPPLFPECKSDDEMMNYRGSMPDFVYKRLELAYKRLWGYPDHMIADSEIDGIPYLLEAHFIQNWHRVTGSDCPYVGKLIYLYLADGYD